MRSSKVMPTRRWHNNDKPTYREGQRNDNKEDQWSNWCKDNQEQKTYIIMMVTRNIEMNQRAHNQGVSGKKISIVEELRYIQI